MGLLTLLLLASPDAQARPHMLRDVQAAPAVAWVGLDFSYVRIFTPETFSDPEERVYWDPGGGMKDTVTRFKTPKDAWTQLVNDWNTMAVHDHLEDLEKAWARELVVDMPEPDGQTKKTGSVYFESVYDAPKVPVELTEARIQEIVKGYTLKTREGIGFGYVMDRFSYEDKEACVWPTYFDLATRAVIATERICKKPGGTGYRNYWFNVIPATIRDLEKEVKRGDF